MNIDKLDKELDGLSDRELEELLFSIDPIWDSKPVDIIEFIENPYYLGKSTGGGKLIYPYWREKLMEIYPSPYYSPYKLIILGGAIGIGKTSTAAIGSLYDFHLLLCLKDPHRVAKLAYDTKIVSSVISPDLRQGIDAGLGKMISLCIDSQFFNKYMNHRKQKNQTLFKNNCDISPGSRHSHTVGRSIVSAFIDEANFGVIKNQMIDNFNSVDKRIESRFPETSLSCNGGEFPIRTKIWLASSSKDHDSPVNKIKNIQTKINKEKVLSLCPPIWEVKPQSYDMSKTFWVYKGSKTKEPKIIETSESEFIEEKSNCLEVPLALKNNFEADLLVSMTDLAGVPIGSSNKLYKSRTSIYNNAVFSKLFPNNFKLDFEDNDDLIQNYSLHQKYWDNHFHRKHPRYIHIDVALSGDRLGMGASYIKGHKEVVSKNPITLEEQVDVVPEIVTEWCFGLEAKSGQQIPLYKIPKFIKWLSSKGYIIKLVTYDGFQSAYLGQELRISGYSTELLSMDRSSLQHATVRDLIFQNLVVFPNNEILCTEMEELEISADGKKVDHPEKFNNGLTGSKDIVDAVGGSIISAYNNFGNDGLLLSLKEEHPSGKEDKIKEILRKMM